MANRTIVNFSFDTDNEDIRNNIITHLCEMKIIDDGVQFIINDDNLKPHKVIKPAATTLIFCSQKRISDIADLIREEKQDIYNFSISAIQVEGCEVKTIINGLVLQSKADEELEEAIKAKKKKDEEDIQARMDNIGRYNASPSSIPRYKIKSLKNN